MTIDEIETLKETLRDEIKTEIENRNGKFYRIAPAVTTFVSLIMTCIVVPWGVWVTNQIHSMDNQMTAFRTWKDQGPRFTPSDAEAMRLRVHAEVSDRIDSRLLRMEDRLNVMSDMLSQMRGMPYKKSATN